VTKLPPDAERIIRQLDEIDDADDPKMAWAYREPYASGLWARLSALREMAANIAASSLSDLPRPVKPFRVLRRLGLLEELTPHKRKRGEHRRKPDPLGYAVDDMQRIKEMPGSKKQRRDDVVTVELIAAERARRCMPHDGLWGRWCTVDKLGDLEAGEVELAELVERLHKRRRHGAARAELHKRAKLRVK
jgi:hypothetical protein